MFAGGLGSALEKTMLSSLEDNMRVNLLVDRFSFACLVDTDGPRHSPPLSHRYGVVAATEAFLPLLRKKTNGQKRIWITSSALACLGHDEYSKMPAMAAYSISKTAVNM